MQNANAMVFAGMDEHGFACFVDSGVPAKGFTIPARVETGNVACKVAKVVKGDYVRMVDGPDAPVWIRGAYDASTREYELTDADDCNRFKYVKGTKTVFIGFTY